MRALSHSRDPPIENVSHISALESPAMHNMLIAFSFVATLVVPCLFAAFPGKHEIPYDTEASA